jgi:hypothetical protein
MAFVGVELSKVGMQITNKRKKEILTPAVGGLQTSSIFPDCRITRK